MKFLFFILLLIETNQLIAQSDNSFKKPNNKILVVSGGGARGAWGVGVVSGLYKQRGGYKAVFGTSTGSLMAPFILLQKFDELETAYSNVTQKSIFNQNPFRIHYDPQTKTVTTTLKTFKAVIRLICGKKTFGETKNLKKLIHKIFTKNLYKELIHYRETDSILLAVAVTNTRTGGLQIKTDSGYSQLNDMDYERICNWIWASSNEPLLMSYVSDSSYIPGWKEKKHPNDSFYVDGGVREVIPLEEAIKYAVSHNIDSIEVIVNNSKIPESQNWDIHKGGIMNGLERLLAIYNMSTIVYNENYSDLLVKYYNLSKIIPDKFNPALSSGSVNRNIHLRFYFMPDNVAQLYPDELGFVKEAMESLITLGKEYANSPMNVNDMDIDVRTIQTFLKDR
jgi:NTE family protein